MSQDIKGLTEAKNQWENDIKMYNNFSKREQ